VNRNQSFEAHSGESKPGHELQYPGTVLLINGSLVVVTLTNAMSSAFITIMHIAEHATGVYGDPVAAYRYAIAVPFQAWKILIIIYVVVLTSSILIFSETSFDAFGNSLALVFITEIPKIVFQYKGFDFIQRPDLAVEWTRSEPLLEPRWGRMHVLIHAAGFGTMILFQMGNDLLPRWLIMICPAPWDAHPDSYLIPYGCNRDLGSLNTHMFWAQGATWILPKPFVTLLIAKGIAHICGRNVWGITLWFLFLVGFSISTYLHLFLWNTFICEETEKFLPVLANTYCEGFWGTYTVQMIIDGLIFAPSQLLAISFLKGNFSASGRAINLFNLAACSFVIVGYTLLGMLPYLQFRISDTGSETEVLPDLTERPRGGL